MAYIRCTFDEPMPFILNIKWNRLRLISYCSYIEFRAFSQVLHLTDYGLLFDQEKYSVGWTGRSRWKNEVKDYSFRLKFHLFICLVSLYFQCNVYEFHLWMFAKFPSRNRWKSERVKFGEFAEYDNNSFLKSHNFPFVKARCNSLFWYRATYFHPGVWLLFFGIEPPTSTRVFPCCFVTGMSCSINVLSIVPNWRITSAASLLKQSKHC